MYSIMMLILPFVKSNQYPFQPQQTSLYCYTKRDCLHSDYNMMLPPLSYFRLHAWGPFACLSLDC